MDAKVIIRRREQQREYARRKRSYYKKRRTKEESRGRSSGREARETPTAPRAQPAANGRIKSCASVRGSPSEEVVTGRAGAAGSGSTPKSARHGHDMHGHVYRSREPRLPHAAGEKPSPKLQPCLRLWRSAFEAGRPAALDEDLRRARLRQRARQTHSSVSCKQEESSVQEERH